MAPTKAAMPGVATVASASAAAPNKPLQGFGPLDLLDSDPRPCFVIALPHLASTETSTATSAATIAYTNPALNSSGALRDIVLRLPAELTHAQFWSWLTAALPADDRPPAQVSLPYLGLFWTRVVVGGRWAVASANAQSATTTSESPTRSREGRDAVSTGMLYRHGSGGSSLSLSGLSGRDEGLSPQPLLNPETEPFLNAIHAVDWASTPLGAIDDWTPRLQHTVSYVLSDSSPMAIYWGCEYTAIYNEAFCKLCCGGNAELLGRSVLEVWPEMRKHVRDLGWPCRKMTPIEHESRYFIDDEDGMSLETYVRWNMVPMRDGDEFLGIVQSVSDTTRVRLWERRTKMLIDLGEVLIATGDVKSYWAHTIKTLGDYEPRYDVPFAILYSVQPELESDQSDGADSDMPPLHDCPHVCTLEGTLGLDAGHPLAPPALRLSESEDGLSATLRAAMSSCVPVVVSTRDGSLPQSLLANVKWRGFGDPCHAAVVYGIRPTREESPMGLLVLGLNPRRPYDLDYQQYVSLLSQKLRSSLAATVLIEEERKRGRNLVEQAAYDKKRLSDQLAISNKQASQSSERFRSVAKFIPVGMCFGDSEGRITFANDAWHRITGSLSGTAGMRLQAYVVDEDQAKLSNAYQALLRDGTVTFEVRIKPGRHQIAPTGAAEAEEAAAAAAGVVADPDSEFRHILASSKTDRQPDGTIRVLTCVTDVTAHKQTAERAMRVAQEAQNLKRMAEFATTGLYDMDMDGRLLSANNVFFELCGLPKVDLKQEVVVPWPRCVVEEDVAILERSLERLASSGKVQTAEVRLKAPWKTVDAAGNAMEAPRWVLVTMMMVKGPAGEVQFFTGCLSDMSLQKLQFEGERQRKEEAIASKRQQDNFIDITSHEMRNPLSAMILCADAIISSLSGAKEGVAQNPGRTEASPALMDECIENAETIVACAQHQRRIVDDILTMSKLHSKLLAVTPTTVDSVQITRDIIKMFEVEARRVDIELNLVLDRSYAELGHEYLDFDPSRVKQVLINLLTNALKFTKGGFIRRVTVTLKASPVRPTEETAEVQFIPKTTGADADYEQPALQGRGPPVFLMFQVADSGQGLSDEETQKLFRRFVQANAKTHVKYGGSGLGLFISKRLVELQNGAIGVSSREGVGSLFTFYIEAFVPTEAAITQARASTVAAMSASLVPSPAPRSVAGGGDPFNLMPNHVEMAKASTAVQVVSEVAIPKTPDAVPQMMPLPTPGVPTGQAALVEAAAELGLNKILIVEDNVINQKALFRGLTKLGLKVEIANHGLEALERLSETSRDLQLAMRGASAPLLTMDDAGSGAATPRRPPVPIDMILMDVEMPVQDGLTCTRRIRELEADGEMVVSASGSLSALGILQSQPLSSQQQKQQQQQQQLQLQQLLPRVPIIALTANARSEQIEAAIEAGCDDVILKPYRVPELVEKMREVVQRARGARMGSASVESEPVVDVDVDMGVDVEVAGGSPPPVSVGMGMGVGVGVQGEACG